MWQNIVTAFFVLLAILRTKLKKSVRNLQFFRIFNQYKSCLLLSFKIEQKYELCILLIIRLLKLKFRRTIRKALRLVHVNVKLKDKQIVTQK